MKRRPDSNSAKRRLSFEPDFIADSVAKIDFDYLSKKGVKAVLIDLDGTVVSRGQYDVANDIVAALKKQPLKVYIATNRPKGRTLKDLKEQLSANGVIHPIGIWGKPFAKYYAQAAAEHGLDPKELVMIGDRYLQDILGANAAGLRTVLVKKLDRPTNLFDKVLSNIEKRKTDQLSDVYVPIK